MSYQCKVCTGECKSGEQHVCWQCWADTKQIRAFTINRPTGQCNWCGVSGGFREICAPCFTQVMCTSGPPVPWIGLTANGTPAPAVSAAAPGTGTPLSPLAKVCVHCSGRSGDHDLSCALAPLEGGHVFHLPSARAANSVLAVYCRCGFAIDVTTWAETHRPPFSACHLSPPVMVGLAAQLGLAGPLDSNKPKRAEGKCCSGCGADWCEYLDSSFAKDVWSKTRCANCRRKAGRAA